MFLPPEEFVPASTVYLAEFAPHEPSQVNSAARRSSGSPPRAALRTGVRYEQKVHLFVADEWKSLGSYRPGSWIRFVDDSGRRFCQPDGLLIRDHEVVLVEVKIAHTQRAWWQLRKLYAPVVKKLFPHRDVIVLEICKTCDTRMSFPEPITYHASFSDLMTKTPLTKDDFHVVTLNP